MDLRAAWVKPPRRRSPIGQKLGSLLHSIGRERCEPEPFTSAKAVGFGPEHDDYTETRNTLTWLGL